MTPLGADQGSRERRVHDGQIAAEPALAPPVLPPDAAPSPVDAHLGQYRRRSVPVARLVENG